MTHYLLDTEISLHRLWQLGFNGSVAMYSLGGLSSIVPICKIFPMTATGTFRNKNASFTPININIECETGTTIKKIFDFGFVKKGSAECYKPNSAKEC